MKRDRRIAEELLSEPKECAEHIMLVDLARNDLGAVCRIGSVRVDELMVIERYSHVMHIVSNVVGELRPELDALDLFAASFPAGTVTGAPKIRAMQLIDELEPVARGLCRQRRPHRLRRRHGLVHHPALGRRCRRPCVLASLGRNRRRQRTGRRIRRDLRQDGDRARRAGDRPVTGLLLVDNYDSFTWNLAHLFGALPDVRVEVVRNDDPSLDAHGCARSTAF
jgi:hypothetical protein